jgi:hypothetical protein
MADVVPPDLTLKMLIFVRDVIQNIKNENPSSIKKMRTYIKKLIPILKLNASLLPEIATQLTELSLIKEKDLKDYILRNTVTSIMLIKSLTTYIGLFITGLESLSKSTSAIDERIRISRESSKDVSEIPEIGHFIHCHGQNLIYTTPDGKNDFETFESKCGIFKFTSAPLCMIENSSPAQDKYITDFFLILDEYYKRRHGESIFTKDVNSIILANYFICKFYKDYTCDIYKNVHKSTSQEYVNNIIEEWETDLNSVDFLYTYPISNASSWEPLPYTSDNPQKTSISDLLSPRDVDRSKHPFPSRVTITSPDVEPNIQRNKIYSVENTTEATSLDIIILTSFKFNFLGSPEIVVAAGDSLLTLLLKLNITYPAQMQEIIRLYNQTYKNDMSTEGARAYDFSQSLSISNISRPTKKTITSTSLRFISFFYKVIGARKLTLFDFSCGVLDFTPEGADQSDETVEALQHKGLTQEEYVSDIEEENEGLKMAGGMPIVTKSYSKYITQQNKKNTTRRNKNNTKRRNKNNTKRRNKKNTKRRNKNNTKRRNKNNTKRRNKINVK